MTAVARWKGVGVGALGLGAVTVTLFLPPVSQDPSYHQFADGRALLGIPNALNVASNGPLIVMGVLGAAFLLSRHGARPFRNDWERHPYLLLLGSIFLVGFGSSYYHWNPGGPRLFWDRLPMTLMFTSFLGIMIVERIDERWGARLFVPLVAAGVASLLYGQARNDFRFYGLLQGAAMVGVPLALLLFPRRYSRAVDLWVIVLLYGIAKLGETFDGPIYRLGLGVSGHTLKHLLGGLAAWKIVAMLKKRRPLEQLPA